MWWVVLLVGLGRVTHGSPPTYAFASFNNARAKSLVEVWSRSHRTTRQHAHLAAVLLLHNPRTFAIVAVPHEPDRSGISVLICERRPTSNVVRMCLWAAAHNAPDRGECTRQAAVWHHRHLANGKAFVLDPFQL